jgi:hypothetical protein
MIEKSANAELNLFDGYMALLFCLYNPKSVPPLYSFTLVGFKRVCPKISSFLGIPAFLQQPISTIVIVVYPLLLPDM